MGIAKVVVSKVAIIVLAASYCSSAQLNCNIRNSTNQYDYDVCYHDVHARMFYYYRFDFYILNNSSNNIEWYKARIKCRGSATGSNRFVSTISGPLPLDLVSVSSQQEMDFIVNAATSFTSNRNKSITALSKRILLGLWQRGWVDYSNTSFIVTKINFTRDVPARASCYDPARNSTRRDVCRYCAYYSRISKSYGAMVCRNFSNYGPRKEVLNVCKARRAVVTTTPTSTSTIVTTASTLPSTIPSTSNSTMARRTTKRPRQLKRRPKNDASPKLVATLSLMVPTVLVASTLCSSLRL